MRLKCTPMKGQNSGSDQSGDKDKKQRETGQRQKEVTGQ